MYARGHEDGTRKQRPSSTAWYAAIEAETLAQLDAEAQGPVTMWVHPVDSRKHYAGGEYAHEGITYAGDYTAIIYLLWDGMQTQEQR